MNPEDEVYGDQDERENVESAYEQQDETLEEQQEEAWPSPEVRVRAGIAWLYEVEPDWLSRINVDTLNIASGESCMAAQLEECCYMCFFARHGFEVGSGRNRFMKVHGFIGVTLGNSDDDALTVAWKQAITALRD